MTEGIHVKRLTHGLLMGLVVAGGAVAAQPAFPGEAPPPAETPHAVPETAPGMTIYIDPQTGAILRQPAPGTVPLQLTPQLQNALSTSHQGLLETPGPVSGGGVKVDLQGRFRSPLFVTIDANGKVKMRHLDEAPEAGDKK